MHESKCKDDDGPEASQSRGLLIASGGGDTGAVVGLSDRAPFI